MNAPQPYAIGIDVGGTNIKTVAVTLTGERLFESQQPTEETHTAWAERIRQVIGEIQAEQTRPAGYIGLAAPGLVAPNGRSIAWMQGRMESLQNLDWTDYLQSSRVIPVLNDAQAALFGEVWKGAAAGCRNVVMLTLGTGVGGGAMVEGHLLRGHLGRAGHLGHISVNPDGPLDIVNTPGSLEDAIGECTIKTRSKGRFDSTAALVEAYRSGDREAVGIWLLSLQALAAGIISLINVLDPEVVILGGGIIRAGEALLGPLRQYMEQWEWRPTGSRVRVVTAVLAEMAGAWGAAYNAMAVNAALTHSSPSPEVSGEGAGR